MPLRPLQRSMSRESTETSRLVDRGHRNSQDHARDSAYDEDDVDDFISGKLPRS